MAIPPMLPSDLGAVAQKFHFPETPSRRMRAGEFHFTIDNTIDMSSVLTMIEGVVAETVHASAIRAHETAYKLAPVRRIIKGDRGGKTRKLSPTERAAEQPMRVQLGFRSGRVIRTAAEDRRIRHMPSNPYLRAPGRRPPRSEPPELTPTKSGFAIGSNVDLNRFGRKELARGVAIQGPTIYGRGDDAEVRRNRALLKKTNSAVYYQRKGRSSGSTGQAPTGKYRLGGRLRGEIYVEEGDEEGGIIKWWVISPTYYSRYVEFGTRHNKAQPYLRPALAIERRKLLDQMRSKLSRLNWKPKRKHVRTSVT